MNSYDEVPYPSVCYPFTHPDRLEAIARLVGLNPAPSTSARVLELGCSSGGNLLPMAETLPDARFIGIELSPRQVAMGGEMQAMARLTNVNLLEQDILAIGPDIGKFDFIIAHGVYSWTSPNVRDRLLALCRQMLAANGVAYVSYNTLPGWKMHGLVREMMLYHTRSARVQIERISQARQFLRGLQAALGNSQAAYSRLLLEHVEQIGRMADGHLAHDHLEADNQPVYFHEFAAASNGAGLQFVCEANPADSDLSRLSEQARAIVTAGAESVIDIEQKFDFLCNRSLRRTLLTHREQTVDRHITHDRTAGLYFAAEIHMNSEEEALPTSAPVSMRTGLGRQFSISDPVAKSGMTELGRVWPKSIGFEELCSTVAEALAKRGWPGRFGENDKKLLAESLIHGVMSGVCEVRSHWPSFVTEVSQRPRLSPLALVQARQRIPIANCRHEPVLLDESAAAFLTHVDGMRSLAELEALANGSGKISERSEAKHATAQLSPSNTAIQPAAVRQLLQSAAQNALLVG